MSQWQVQIGQKTHGPFSSEQLKQLATQGKLPQNALVRQGTEGTWYAASSIRGLFDNVGTPPPPRPVTPKQPMQPVQQQPMQQMQPAPQFQPGQQMPTAQGFGAPGYGTPTQPMYRQSGGGGEPARWKKVSIGLLILASVFGVVALSGAVVLHEGSTILVVLNALRLLRYRG